MSSHVKVLEDAERIAPDREIPGAKVGAVLGVVIAHLGELDNLSDLELGLGEPEADEQAEPGEVRGEPGTREAALGEPADPEHGGR